MSGLSLMRRGEAGRSTNAQQDDQGGIDMLKSLLLSGGVTLALLSGAAVVAQDKPIIGLITKTEGNPFFVKMREGAEEKADELGFELRALAGAFDGDNEGQIAAIESLIAAGAKGFAIVPSDSSAIVPTIQSARDAGLVVIVLDTPLDPMDAATATFATDNRKAGNLIGQWAAKTLGDKAKDA
jgi:fructose transport system substrate-binding protein